METFYFTWGSGHHDTKGRSLLGWYTSVEAEDYDAARAKMFERFGAKWSFQYTKEEFEGQVEKYNLQYERFELVDLCCQVTQQDWLNIKKQVEELQS